MMDSGWDPREGIFLSLGLIVHWLLAVVLTCKEVAHKGPAVMLCYAVLYFEYVQAKKLTATEKVHQLEELLIYFCAAEMLHNCVSCNFKNKVNLSDQLVHYKFMFSTRTI